MAGSQFNMQNYAQALQQTIQAAKVEMLLKGMTDLCFQKCIEKPKSSFRRGDKKCVGNCVTLYSQSLGIIESTLIEAAEAQMNDMSEGTQAYEGFGDSDFVSGGDQSKNDYW